MARTLAEAQNTRAQPRDENWLPKNEEKAPFLCLFLGALKGKYPKIEILDH